MGWGVADQAVSSITNFAGALFGENGHSVLRIAADSPLAGLSSVVAGQHRSAG